MEPLAVVKDSSASKAQGTKIYDKDLVRTDSRNQKIEKFLSTTSESLSSTLNQEQSFNETRDDSRISCFEDSFVASDLEKCLDKRPNRAQEEVIQEDESEIPVKVLRTNLEQLPDAKKHVPNKMQLPNVIPPKPFVPAVSSSERHSEIMEHPKTVCTPRREHTKLPVVNKGYCFMYI